MKPEKKTENNLYSKIEDLLSIARKKAVQAVNQTMVHTYFEIGKIIVEDQQKGVKVERHKVRWGGKGRPRAAQDRPKKPQEHPEIGSRGPRPPPDVPRPSHKGQSWSKKLKDHRKTSQEAPKTCPRGPKTASTDK